MAMTHWVLVKEIQLLCLSCVLSSDPCQMISQILPLSKLLRRLTAFTGVARLMYLYHMLLQLQFLFEAGHLSTGCKVYYSRVGILRTVRRMKGVYWDCFQRLFLRIVLAILIQLNALHADVALVAICMSSGYMLSKLIFVWEGAQADILRIIWFRIGTGECVSLCGVFRTHMSLKAVFAFATKITALLLTHEWLYVYMHWDNVSL